MIALYELEGRGGQAAMDRVNDIFKTYDIDRNKSLDKAEFVNLVTHDPFLSKMFT